MGFKSPMWYMGSNKGLYSRGPYSYAYRYEQNMTRYEKGIAGREPNDPAQLKKGDKWIDPIAQVPQLKELRTKYLPPDPKTRIYLKRE